MELKEVYKQLTSVDIDEQKRVWDERGKGYYGEYLLFCELYKEISGFCKILMNLRIPVSSAHTTEIDLLLIHETGLYVFEIKHYKGIIYGKDTDAVWTQYFRTAKNNTFKNPIEQNGYHIRALKKLFPNTPIRSCIVFTSSECDIRVHNSNSEIDICLLRNVGSTLAGRFQKSNPVLSMEEIDKIFNQMTLYSRMREAVVINKTEADFLNWVQTTISDLEKKKKELEEEKANLIYANEKLKKRQKIELEQEKEKWNRANDRLKGQKRKGIFANIIIAIACVAVSIIVILGFQEGYDLAIQKNNEELSEFKQNFLHVDEIGDEYIDALNSYVTVSNVSLVPLSDNAVSFTARLSMSNDVYGMALTEDSKYIVMTGSGKVFEYDVFGEHLRYYRSANRLGKGIRSYGDLATIQFHGVSLEELEYIKITKLELFKLDDNTTVIKDNLELELYSKY